MHFRRNFNVWACPGLYRAEPPHDHDVVAHINYPQCILLTSIGMASCYDPVPVHLSHSVPTQA